MGRLHRIGHHFFTPHSLDPSDRYREQILRIMLPILIILNPIATYFLLYDNPASLPSPLTSEIVIITWYLPYIIAIGAVYRGKIQVAIWAFMISWFINNQRGVILDGYWDINLRTALILELVFAAFMLQRTRWLFLYALAQMFVYSLLAINLEGSWYSAPTYFSESTSLPPPYAVIIATNIFHLLFFIVLRILKLEFDRRQKSLQEVIDTLEERISERTSELETANHQLTLLAEAKDAFVSNVSHELRTPISSILLTVQTLKRMQAKQHEPRYDRLIRDTKRLNNMIEALLLLSRLDQDQISLKQEKLDVNSLVKTLVGDRVILAKQQGITLSSQLSQQPAFIIGDFAMIEQLLSILITNAINYTPSEGKIVVSTQVNTGQLKISVMDTGIGVEADNLSHLFERFFRGNMNVPGTGLGLAIAHEIVLKHEGHIDVKSEGLGLGTTFTVTLLLYSE